jgi:hypothetical protein
MELIGARLRQVAVGQVEIEAPIREDLSQQHHHQVEEQLQGRDPVPVVGLPILLVDVGHVRSWLTVRSGAGASSVLARVCRSPPPAVSA